jgi:collagenase-like protein with putative collagen-binding domain
MACRMNLARMTPRPDLASSRFCLADVGTEYLVYLPTMRSAIADLSAVNGRVTAQWFNPATGRMADGGAAPGGALRFLTAPFVDDAVLYLRALSENRRPTSTIVPVGEDAGVRSIAAGARPR